MKQEHEVGWAAAPKRPEADADAVEDAEDPAGASAAASSIGNVDADNAVEAD